MVLFLKTFFFKTIYYVKIVSNGRNLFTEFRKIIFYFQYHHIILNNPMFPFIMRVGWLNILIYYDLKGIAQSPREISFNGVWHRNISRSDIGSGFQSQQVFVCTFSVKTCMTTVFCFALNLQAQNYVHFKSWDSM